MIRYQCGYKYQVVESYSHRLPGVFRGFPSFDCGLYAYADGILTLRRGYAWDGPSGPSFDTKTFMRASLVHDGLYQAMREGYLPRDMKDDADQEMRRICLQDGMWKVRAWWCFRAVQRFGVGATIHNKDILVAP